MPQRRKPTALKLIEGNPGKRSLNHNEPKPPSEFPTMPRGLNAIEKAEWKRLATELPKVPGLITRIDGPLLHAYVQCYAQWIEISKIMRDLAKQDPVTKGMMLRGKNGQAYTNPLLRQQRQIRGELLRLAAEFGFSPVARTRIVLPDGSKANEPDDEWDDF
jgi:P27 family predicted phage terminase small subunit